MSSTTPQSFAELGLRPEILRAVAEAGYTTPTPIQLQAIPLILEGLDVMGGAQTGTGKTAGFALPILQKLLQSGGGRAARGWRRFGRDGQAVRYTEAWEHETFAEEQARWERSDPEYARICEEVRQAKEGGGQASRGADQVKAEWDARAARQRQASDDAQRAHHALKADQTARPRPATSRISLA